MSPNWPPPYTIRASSRSKRLHLRISGQGLEIITPKKMNRQTAIEFLDSKKTWVEKHWYLTSIPKIRTQFPPNEVNLAAIDEVWKVKFFTSETKTIYSNDESKEITISAENNLASFVLLRIWLREKAKIPLQQILSECSVKYQIPYNHFKIRFQQSRWGSCSTLKNINLNCKLLLLPYELVHYVVVHELIHTIHLNHSEDFWNTVKKIIPHYKELKTKLKYLELQLPNWLHLQ